MSAVLLGTPEPQSPEWYAIRREGIGASEIAAVAGLSPWVSAFQLWHRKKGNIPEQAQSGAMGWGHRLEPVVRDWWQEQHPDLGVIATPGVYAREDRTWQRVSPDGLVVDRAGLVVGLYEGKTTSAFSASEWGPSMSTQIPLHYRCQIQHALDVFGLPVAYVAVLIGGNDAREYVVEYDEADAEALRDAGKRFWDSLQSDDEPPIDASFETYQAVRELHPDISKDDEVELPEHLARNYTLAKQFLDESTDRLTQAKSLILAAMGTAQFATFDGRRIFRRQVSSAGNPYLKDIA